MKTGTQLNRTSAQTLAFVFHELAALITAGQPVDNALNTAAESATGGLRRVLKQLSAYTGGGSPLSQGIRHYPDFFPPVVPAMVAAAELSGQLDLAFRQLAQFFEFEAELRRTLLGALVYPAIVLFTALGAAALLAYIGFMPGTIASRLLWAVLVIAVVVVLMRFRFFQRATYYTALILPGFSQIMLELSAARMCLVFGMLVRAGVPYLEGLEATRRSVLNPMVTKAVDNLYAAVRAGNTVTDALRRERLLPGIIARLVSSGEAAGSLDESLLRAGEYLMQNAHYRIRNASKFAGPVAVVVMGIIVLIIAVSFMGSYFEQIFSLLEE